MDLKCLVSKCAEDIQALDWLELRKEIVGGLSTGSPAPWLIIKRKWDEAGVKLGFGKEMHSVLLRVVDRIERRHELTQAQKKDRNKLNHPCPPP